LECLYCKHFHLSEKVDIVINRKTKNKVLKKRRPRPKSYRICYLTEKRVTKRTEQCERFQLYKFFRCRKNGYFVTAEICQNRRRPRIVNLNAHVACKKCTQWKQWIKLFREIKLNKRRTKKQRENMVVKKVRLKRRRIKNEPTGRKKSGYSESKKRGRSTRRVGRVLKGRRISRRVNNHA